MSNEAEADVIQLEHVRKDFGDFTAVHEADIAIRHGEFFSLLGPSGCGKTTILKMIAGFEQPTSGVVRIGGVDVSGVPPHKRNVNTVFQQYALFPHMTVADNVGFGPRMRKVPAAEAKKNVAEMLDVVRLAPFAARRPAQLSGGQQQRVALARALVNFPDALLLDEPLAALDLKLREAMQIELKRIQREVGITFVFVTHDQGEALTMSDRIAVMSEGRVEQIGSPEEIYRRPASLFVAGFIGSANLLPGTVSGVSGGALTIDLVCGGTVQVGAEGCAPEVTRAAGEKVTVMLRPEHLEVADVAPTGASLAARVTDVVFQGPSVKLVVRTGDGTEISTLVAGDPRTGFLRPGSEVWLTWLADAPYALDDWPSVAGATTTNVDQVEAGL